MENDVMNELLKFIFGKKPTRDDIILAHSSNPETWLTEDFLMNLQHVLFFKSIIISFRIHGEFDKYSRRMLSSHKDYLLSVMLTCLREHEQNQNNFETFISVCVLVMSMNDEILMKTGLDFSDLNRDIFLVFIRNVLKTSFERREDFNRFVDFIRGHNYLSWNKNDIYLKNEQNVLLGQGLSQKINEEFNRLRCLEKVAFDTKSSNLGIAESLAQEVLLTTTFEFPTFPSEFDLIKRLVEYKKMEKEKREQTLTVENSHEDSSSNSDVKAKYFTKQQDDITWHEKIIQAVIRHNHLKNPGHAKTNNQIKKADGILEHMNNTIQSLTEVLDKCS